MSIWPVLSVLGLLVLFGGLSWWIRRLSGQPKGDSAIMIQTQRSLDPGTRLWIVEVEGRRLLLGGGRSGVTLICELDPGTPES